MIELRGVSIDAGEFSLTEISFVVPTGKYAVLMGRTGHGKTTLLEIICGLRRPNRGSVLIDGKDVTRWQPGDRQIGYVPQDLALFPTHTVRQHLEFALRLRSTAAGVIQERTRELSNALAIKHLLERSVADLSGGESQRVALGRALSFRPSVLLLDEPLSALDEETRTEMHTLLIDLQKNIGITVLHVTHSRDEAKALADITFSLVDGKVTS